MSIIELKRHENQDEKFKSFVTDVFVIQKS